MSNVIPQAARKEVARAYRARYLLTASLMLLALALSSALAFVPGYLTLRAAMAPVPGTPTDAATQSDHDAIAAAHAYLDALTPLTSATTTPTDALALVLAHRESGIRINAFSYTPGATSDTLVVSGNAATPSALDAYRRALAAEPLFSSVSVPVSDLVGVQDGRFSMTLIGSF